MELTAAGLIVDTSRCIENPLKQSPGHWVTSLSTSLPTLLKNLF